MKIKTFFKTKISVGIVIIVLELMICISILIAIAMQDNLHLAQPGDNIKIISTPEQLQAMEHEDFIVEEYVSVIPDGENIIRDGKIEANNFTDVYTPQKVMDGNVNGKSYWEGGADAFPNILTLTFKESKNIHAMRLCLCPLPVWGKRIQEFSIEISTDGENFTEFLPPAEYEFSPDKNNEIVIEFDETQVTAVRINFTKNTGASGAQLAEWEIYSHF